MSLKFVPSDAQGKDAEFKGHLVIKGINCDASWEIMDTLGLEFDDEGKVSLRGMNGKKLGALSRLAKEYVSEVKLTHLPSNKDYGSYDDLNGDLKCRSILMEVGNYLISGQTPEKK